MVFEEIIVECCVVNEITLKQCHFRTGSDVVARLSQKPHFIDFSVISLEPTVFIDGSHKSTHRSTLSPQ